MVSTVLGGKTYLACENLLSLVHVTFKSNNLAVQPMINKTICQLYMFNRSIRLTNSISFMGLPHSFQVQTSTC